MDKIAVKVIRKTTEAKDIVSFELASADGSPLAAFSAGAHIDVHIPGGLTRQYSLCNDATEQHRYRIAVLRDAASRGGMTRSTLEMRFLSVHQRTISLFNMPRVPCFLPGASA